MKLYDIATKTTFEVGDATKCVRAQAHDRLAINPLTAARLRTVRADALAPGERAYFARDAEGLWWQAERVGEQS